MKNTGPVNRNDVPTSDEMSTLDPHSTAEEALACLRSLAGERGVEGLARFGIDTDTALGISNPMLRSLARKLKRDHLRAQALWASGIREARLLAAFTSEPKKIGLDQARAWAAEFNSWEIVDAVSDLFIDAKLYPVLVPEFAADEREFVRRAAFAMMAQGAVHLKKEPDEIALAWLPLVEAHSTDARNFIKKAVNWALRQIGKRSLACYGPALMLAEKLADSPDKTARWIGKDAVRELSADKIRARIKS